METQERERGARSDHDDPHILTGLRSGSARVVNLGFGESSTNAENVVFMNEMK